MAETTPRILVVDDAQAALEAASSALREHGFEVREARDGREALRLQAAAPVDAVVLDVEIPELDGLQTLRLLKAAAAERYLPVLLMSLREDREVRVAAFRLGADDFLTKPVDAEELVARVQRALNVRARFNALAEEVAAGRPLGTLDELTRLLPRKVFEDRLREEFKRAQRYDDPLALLILDLDHFRALNDRFGRPAGDAHLQGVAEALRKSVRDTDVLARYGGEEFAVLLPKTHLAGALTVAERVWRDVGAVVGPERTAVTASLGVSGYPNRSVLTAEQLFKTADDALYRAKREGRNKICLYQQASLFSLPPVPA
jgi:two-component system cell cycle response regulator